MVNNRFLKAVLIGTVALLLLVGCGGKKEEVINQGAETTNAKAADQAQGTKEEETAKQDVAAEMDIQEFAKKIVERRTDISFAEMTEGYISGVMDFDVSKTAEYKVYVDATGSTIDEFGIFKANGGSEKEVEEMLKYYLNTRLNTWMDEYMPEEKPKLEKAEIKANGQYYIYAILGDGEKEQVFSDFDSVLLK